jgi:tetratricopeptide (TPR) repeat protein
VVLRRRLALPALLAVLLAACATQRVDPGVDPAAVSRVVGDVMSAQARLGVDDKLAALADLERFLLQTDLRTERVARALNQLADLYLTIEVNTYRRALRRADGGGAVLRHDRSIPLYRKVLADYPERAANHEVYYQLARAYDDLGNTAKEAETLTALVERAPAGPHLGEAWFRLGELAFDDGRFNRAEARYAAALKAGGDERMVDFAAYKRAWALYLMPDYDRAMEAAVAFLDDRRVDRGQGPVLDSRAMPEPDWERVREVMFILARMLDDEGDVPALERLFAHGRDYLPLLYRRLGEVQAQMGDPAAGVATYDAFIRAHPDSPLAPDFLGYMVDLYTDERDVKRAVAVRERLVRDYAPGGAWWEKQGAATRRRMAPVIRQTAQRLARHYHSVAQETQAAADYARAADAYRRVLAAYPDGPGEGETRFLLGEVLFEAGDYGAAAEAYRGAAYDVPVHKRSGEAAYAAVFARERLLGETPGDGPDYDARLTALADEFNRMVLAFPREPRVEAAYERITGLLFERGGYDALYRMTDHMLRYGPRSRGLHTRAWRILGEAALKTGRLEEAETALVQALDYVTDDVEEAGRIRRLLAAVYVSRADAPGVDDQAAGGWLLKAAAVVAPDDPLARTARVDAGLAYVRAQDVPAALDTFGAFLSAYPGDPQEEKIARAVVQMGEEALARNDTEAAQAAWDRYLQWFAGRWPERDRVIGAYQGRTRLAEGDLTAADTAFTALLGSYAEGQAPEEEVDRLAGIRFKRAAARIEAGDPAGLDILQGVADDLPNSRIAPKALEAIVTSAGSVGAPPERALAAAALLVARYPDREEAEAAKDAEPDLLVAAGRHGDAARALLERAGEVPHDRARALRLRAVGLLADHGEVDAAVEVLAGLRDDFLPGSDAWVAAERDRLRVALARSTRWPEDDPALDRALNEGLLEAIAPLADADVLGAEGRRLGAELWLARAADARKGFEAVRLVPPLKENLAAKQAALKEALEAFGSAAGYRSRDATLNATRQTGEVLEDFANALLASPVPGELTEAQGEIYRRALAKRAAPYLARAVKAHEQNLERARDGLAGPDVEASVLALGRLRPDRYDRPEIGVRPVDAR